jgi:hypothetical protein
VIIWKRPTDFGVLLAAIATSFWLYSTTTYTLVSIVSFGTVAWAVLSWLLSVTAFRIPWQLLVPLESAPGGVDHFEEVVAFLVQVRFAFVDAVEELQRFKAANPNRFVLQIAVSGLLLSYLGSFISGQLLIILLIYGALVLPGALFNGVPSRLATLAEPHVKVYRERAGVLIASISQQIDQQINKTKHNGQHTTTTITTTTTVISEEIPPTSPPTDSPLVVDESNIISKKDD